MAKYQHDGGTRGGKRLILLHILFYNGIVIYLAIWPNVHSPWFVGQIELAKSTR
jgi:hypothetical protein